MDRGCSNQKSSPCGGSCDSRSDRVSVFEPGETITVRWDETINHPGHYRIAFDDDGSDDFADPADFDDIQDPPVLPVLLDGIADKNGGIYEVQVTLPDVECENCTLQLIQMMTEKGPTYGDNDLYYRCADLALRSGGGGSPDAGNGGPPDAGGGGGGDDGGGCHSGSGTPGGAALLGFAGLWLMTRRRRSRA